MIYLIIGFFASVAGGFSALGGGFLIKPLLDSLTSLSSMEISFYTTWIIVALTSAAVMKQYYLKTPYEAVTVFLGIGSVFGGWAGVKIFNETIDFVNSDEMVKFFQNAILFALLIIVIIYLNANNKVQRYTRSRVAALAAGFLSGVLCSYLNISGGPIIIAILVFFFGMNVKTAAANTIIIVLLSQVSKLLTITFAADIPESINYTVLWTLVLSSLIGSCIGFLFGKKVSERSIQIVYNTLMVFVALVCLWNVVTL